MLASPTPRLFRWLVSAKDQKEKEGARTATTAGQQLQYFKD